MNTSDLSPAYLTSLAAIIFGTVLMGSIDALWVAVIGWIFIVAGIGLNIFSTHVMIQRLKGGPLPGVLTGGATPVEYYEEEDTVATDLIEPEPVTEAQPVLTAEADEPADEDRIFRSRPSGVPRVR